MKRLALVCGMLLALAAPAGAFANPTLTQIFVGASDGGGWTTYSSSANYYGVFSLYVARDGNPLDGSLDWLSADTLANGTTTYGVVGTDGNGPGTTQTARLTIDGNELAVPNGGSATAVFGSSLVTASFTWKNTSDGNLQYIDRVAVNGLYPDGYVDSYGTVTFAVTPLDTTPPTIVAAASAPPNANGWNNADVTVLFTCTDDGSGVNTTASSLASQTLNASGTATGTCIDNAGNSASTSYTAQIDKAAPTLTITGNAGTYRIDQNVAIACTATDTLSGIATPCSGVSGPATGFGVGAHTVTVGATDKAGNSATTAVTFTVSAPTAGSVASLTSVYIDGSPRYAALTPAQKAAVDALSSAATTAIARIVPQMSANQKAAFVRSYDVAVNLLVATGWLTASQAATLEALAGTL
ncbi:MAG: hypothetical protein JWM06_1435 [Actinomycetia bacterium]|nr:hypothetical protein [Actinomycetes bacterium]